MANVRREDIQAALRPWLGHAVVEQTTICDQLHQVFLTYAPYKETYNDLANRIEHALFAGLYSVLGENMTLRREDGALVRIRMSDLPDLADAAMYAFFIGMEVYSVNYENLRAYVMETGSHSAMLALCNRFGRYLPQEDREVMEKLLREGGRI